MQKYISWLLKTGKKHQSVEKVLRDSRVNPIWKENEEISGTVDESMGGRKWKKKWCGRAQQG